MSIGKYILCVIVAYIAYAVFYVGLTMFVFADLFMANADLMRPQDDPMAMYAFAGHFLQTCMVVALFNMAVGSSDVKRGAIFGLLMGGYLLATDMTFYFGMKMSTAPLGVSAVIHLAVGAVVGVLLAKLYGMGGNKEVAAEA